SPRPCCVSCFATKFASTRKNPPPPRSSYNSGFLPQGESMSLSGRVALVTGASQGIGRACALKFAASGAALAVVARNREKLDSLVSEITASGGNAAAFPMDVADEQQIKSGFKEVLARLGRIDILVNNAGII